MLTRRADYEHVGGFDEINFPINFNDVDYCLKLRALGKRIVFTPHAQLLHLEFGKPRPGPRHQTAPPALSGSCASCARAGCMC